MATSEALIQSTTRHQVYLERLKSGEVNQFASFLRDIDKSIRDRLASNDLTDFSRARLNKLLASVDRDLKEIFDNHYQELAGHLTDIGEYEAGFEARNIANAIVPGAFETVIPAASQVRAAVFSTPLSVRGADGGKLLEPFIKDWSNVERKRLTGAIRQGFFEGQTNFQIIRAIRGTKASGYRDGLLQTTSRNADAIVRTAVQHSASVARFETWRENDDLVTGYRWVSTLDSRTSSICRSLDGQVYDIGKGPKPPIHIRCRSTTVAELSTEHDFLKEGRTRASKDGPVDANETYYSWLKKQPLEFQKDAIGVTRARLLVDGGLSADDFAKLNMGSNFKPLTLAEMRTKEPLAFKAAEEKTPLTKAAENAKIKQSRQRADLLDGWMTERRYRREAGRVANPRIKKQAEEYGLTQAEQVAISYYSGAGYLEINSSLRGGSGVMNRPATVLREGLERLPDFKGRTVRRVSLPPEALEIHRIGKVVEYKAFTSATFGKNDVFSDKPHRLVIESVTGKKIDWISRYGANEKEVLYTSPTKFLVRSRVEKDGIVEIKLKELPND